MCYEWDIDNKAGRMPLHFIKDSSKMMPLKEGVNCRIHSSKTREQHHTGEEASMSGTFVWLWARSASHSC